jgi:ArsR family transcriptional regulator, arsenate/arsenite/antimonite-responsive transcriptional repressor
MERPTRTLSEAQLRSIAKALSDPKRFELLKQIGAASTALTCTVAQKCLAISAPTLSHHVRELNQAELIEVRREGKFAHLSLNRDVLDAYIRHLQSL